jgi:hypothetical protein
MDYNSIAILSFEDWDRIKKVRPSELTKLSHKVEYQENCVKIHMKIPRKFEPNEIKEYKIIKGLYYYRCLHGRTKEIDTVIIIDNDALLDYNSDLTT